MAIVSRRTVLGSIPCALAGAAGGLRLSTFQANVTPPLGGPLFNAVRARSIADPLEAHGFVLCGSGQPLVLAAVDWCEIRNETFERWRSVLAGAAGTDPKRVLVSCVHQHDAPYSDVVAQRLLKANGVREDLCDPEFDERTLQGVASAVRESLKSSRRITHVGVGQGKVERVASNRRYVMDDGKVSFGRVSATRDPAVRAKPEGTIDPWLKTISFWDGEIPVAAISSYATHPMTFYGKGDVSCDFPGLAGRAGKGKRPASSRSTAQGAAGTLSRAIQRRQP